MQKLKLISKDINQSSEGRAHCRNVIGIDGKTKNFIDAQEKVRSLNSRVIKKLTVLIISCNGFYPTLEV
jgi:hypothetical protein